MLQEAKSGGNDEGRFQRRCVSGVWVSVMVGGRGVKGSMGGINRSGGSVTQSESRE
jgi:hypothetical protein